MHILTIVLLSSLLLLLCSCSGMTIDGRIDNANNIAQQYSLNKTQYHAGRFTFTAWQKITNINNSVANIYIEGDGLAWLSRSEPSLNPTPKNPIALKLAGIDNSENVVYLARPCQFTSFDIKNNNCKINDWTDERFSFEIIQSFNDILNQIKVNTSITKFNLIGYSGGANIAGLLAVKRDDIISLRSIAGNIDNDEFTKMHNVSNMPNSLNMANYIDELNNIPQVHFVGTDDKIIPRLLAERYILKSNNKCIKIYDVNASHDKGWIEQWSKLLLIIPVCNYSHSK